MKKVIISLITVLFTINLCACGNGISNRTLRKMLKENGYSSQIVNSSKIDATLDLKMKGSEGDKLVLVRCNNNYALVVLNTKTNKFVDLAFGYVPLNVIQQEIWNCDKDVNIKDMNIIKKYIEKNGVDCFTYKTFAEEYLREITGKNGLVSTERAQRIISNSTTKIFSEIESSDEVTVLFEEDSAVPMYYTMESTEMVYNWHHLPESVYGVWKASMDRQTQQVAEAMYGPPYVMETVWAVVDSDLKEVGTYNTLEEVKKKLLHTNESKSKSSISKSGTTIVYKINSDKLKTDSLDIAKEILSTRLNDLGYAKNETEIKIKDNNKIEVILPIQDDIKHTAQLLIPDTTLKFVDYNNNILLTENDIQKVSTERNKTTYCVTLEFSEQGRKKFKTATSNISKMAKPDKYIAIILNDDLISAPIITQEIDSELCMISGDLSKEEAKELENKIRNSMYKSSFNIVETR